MAAVYPTLPQPVTWAPGIIRSGRLRADIAGAVALLGRPPLFNGQQNTGPQSITSGITTAITIDTEIADPWNGHQVSTDPAQYFGMLAGWYLAECSVPLAYTGGTGTLSAELGGAQNGGAQAWYGGERVPGNAAHTTVVTSAKLLEMAQVGTFGTGDYMQAGVFQSSGAAQSLSITTSPTVKCPQFSVRWLCALAGTAPLAVPANPAWPVPPAYVTSAFLNANVRDAIRFLTYRPVMETYQVNAQNLASQGLLAGVGTTLNLGSAGQPYTVDNYGAYNEAANTWTAPVAGDYYCYAQAGMTTAAGAASMACGITVTSVNYNGGSAVTLWGGSVAAATSSVQCANTRRRLRLNAGDTIQAAAMYHDTGGAAATMNTSGAWLSRLITVWEGA
jgi:hypothetical protein